MDKLYNELSNLKVLKEEYGIDIPNSDLKRRNKLLDSLLEPAPLELNSQSSIRKENEGQ